MAAILKSLIVDTAKHVHFGVEWEDDARHSLDLLELGVEPDWLRETKLHRIVMPGTPIPVTQASNYLCIACHWSIARV